MSQNEERILTGRWNDNTTWEFYSSSVTPPIELCTAVACVAILKTASLEQIVLTKNHRGWEILGGHIEEGESLEEAVIRESNEEGGFTPVSIQAFGYRKITAKTPVPHDQKDGFYPFPTSYVPHFVAVAHELGGEPTGEEILERRAFGIDEISTLQLKTEPVIKLALESYRQT